MRRTQCKVNYTKNSLRVEKTIKLCIEMEKSFSKSNVQELSVFVKFP